MVQQLAASQLATPALMAGLWTGLAQRLAAVCTCMQCFFRQDFAGGATGCCAVAAGVHSMREGVPAAAVCCPAGKR